MIKFAICDDEPSMRRQLFDQISAYMQERQNLSYQINSFESGQLLLESDCDFDMIFLDIRMGRLSGMETAKRLRQMGKDSLLIFVTILKEWVYDAFEVQAYDYLLKPLDAGRFRRVMDRAVKSWEEGTRKTILIQKGNFCQIISLSQIVYGEVFGRKISLHQADGEVTEYYGKLEELERQVDKRFFRCHRSYLVNLDYVRGCSGGQVSLPHGNKIPVSRLREREMAQALLRHMKERGT